MQKLRLKFSKEKELRYISHLDLMWTMERAFRRAELELRFSEGFNPHPKMSFASALSLGVESQAEYLDLELAKEVFLRTVQERLNNCLPEGIRVLEVEEIKGSGAMSLVAGAAYRIEGTTTAPWPEEKWLQAVVSLLKQEEVWIAREGKKGLREVNIAPLLLQVELEKLKGINFLLKVLVRTGSRGNVRAEEILQAMGKYYELPLAGDEPKVIRIGLYREENQCFFPLISLENEVIELRS